MLKFGKKTSSSPENTDESRPKKGGKDWFKNNQRSIFAVALIAVAAFVIRFVYAFSISAGSGFALSGGTDASTHLHTITQILEGTIPFGIDSTLYYPYGSLNTDPLFMDLFLSQFAMIGKALGMTAASAAAATLGWASVICGTLACIVMYYVAKEAFDSKKAGYLAALFLAFCPMVISETVFSNGTEVAEIELLLLIAAYFLLKGIKAVDVQHEPSEAFKAVLAANKKPLIYAAIAGIFIVLIALSWNGFRSILTILIIMMVVQALVDRFKKRDVRILVMFYSIPILMTIIVGAIYYIPAGLWDAVFSGVCLASILALVCCIVFAFVQKTPWTLVIPIECIAILVIAIVLFYCAPSYFNVIFCGNCTYTAAFAALLGPSGLSLSQAAVGFGPVTLWFVVAVVAVMLWRITKNVSSPLYIFSLVALIAGTYFALRNDFTAVVFSFVFAVSFASVILWIFKNVDFKSYFTSFKGADIKSIWRKIIKPIPFVTIIAIALLIVAPNAMYAMDASIPSNQTTEGLSTGAISYYIKTDSDWKVNDVLDDYYSEGKYGAMITWMDYADDAETYGGFAQIVDTNGNGVEAVSNILLADVTDGSYNAAMLVYMIKYKGIDASKDALTAAGLTESDFDELKDILQNPSKYRDAVLHDTDTFGILSTSVSDENISYIYAKYFLTKHENEVGDEVGYSPYQILKMYENVSASCGKNISYVMIAPAMFPVYYGSSSTFATMAYLNGYEITDSYGTVAQFETADYFTMYYTGVYSYTDAMYNSLLWRSYIGMSPAEAGYTGNLGAYNYLSKLMSSDGSVIPTPGYGLGDYVVDLDHYYVKYNANKDATYSSDGWVKMTYDEAILRVNADGGLVNFLAGYPVVLKHVSTTTGTAVSGKVVDVANNAVSGIRVSVIDSEDSVRSTAITDADGAYTVLVTDSNSKINFYAASETLSDGKLIKTVSFTSGMTTIPDVVVTPTSISGKFVDSDGDDLAATFKSDKIKMEFNGTVSGNKYYADITAADMTFKLDNIIPDIYTYTVTSMDGTTEYVEDTKFTTNVGNNDGLTVTFKSYELKLTLKTESGASVLNDSNVKLTLTSIEDTTVSYETSVAVDGTATVTVPAGTYFYSDVDSVGTEYIIVTAPFEVSSSTTKTVTLVESKIVEFTGIPDGKMALIYGSSYQRSLEGSTGSTTVPLPAGTAGGAVYSIYYSEGNNVYWKAFTAATPLVDVTSEPGFAVTGTMKSSGDAAVSGSIIFSDDATLREIEVNVNADGTYKAMLPNGTYTMYSVTKDKEVLFDKVTVNGEAVTKDIKAVTSKTVTGSAYWYSSSYYLMYTPVLISDITGLDGYKFNLLTGSDGKFTVYLPADATCSATVKVGDSGVYYFDTEGTYELKKTITTSETFKASVKAVQVKNASTFEISVKGTKIAAGATSDITVTSTSWTLSVDYNDGDDYYYLSQSIPAVPMAGVREITVSTTDASAPYYAKTYCILEITDAEAGDTVKIEALDAEAGETRNKTTTGTTREYYLEKDKEFLVKITSSDGTKMMYYDTGAVSGKISIKAEKVPTFNVSGFAGYAHEGVLTVSYASMSIDFDIESSGRYDVKLPYYASTDYDLDAEIIVEEDDVEKYEYYGYITIKAANIAADGSYVYNIVTYGGEIPDTPDVSGALKVLTMSDVTKATVDITFQMDITQDTAAKATYVLSGTDNWNSIIFYRDAGLTEQISTYTMDGISTSGTVYGKGTAFSVYTATDSDAFAVQIKDVNDKEMCKAKFSNTDAAWAKTTPTDKTSVVNFGTDSMGDSEYKYAITLVNKDNFDKEFSVELKTALGDKWYVSFVDGEEIYESESASKQICTFKVTGQTDKTVYIKVTSVNSIKDVTLSNIESEVKIVSGSDKISTDDTTGGITVSGDAATVKSTVMSHAIEVSDASASGRGVVNVKSDTPAYIWVMVTIIIILLVLMVWLAFRRGVFTRKK